MAGNLTILCPVATAIISLQSLSVDSLMPATVTRSPSANFTKLVLTKGCESGSSGSLKLLCIGKSPVCSVLDPGHASSVNARKLQPPQVKIAHYTRSVRKVSDRIFLCEHLMDYNLARLHEPTLNLSAHA